VVTTVKAKEMIVRIKGSKANRMFWMFILTTDLTKERKATQFNTVNRANLMIDALTGVGSLFVTRIRDQPTVTNDTVWTWRGVSWNLGSRVVPIDGKSSEQSIAESRGAQMLSNLYLKILKLAGLITAFTKESRLSKIQRPQRIRSLVYRNECLGIIWIWSWPGTCVAG
jgi:hypothetical protein